MRKQLEQHQEIIWEDLRRHIFDVAKIHGLVDVGIEGEGKNYRDAKRFLHRALKNFYNVIDRKSIKPKDEI